MKVKIEPRKSTDRGGYYCMPLCSNVPKASQGGGLQLVRSVERNAGGSRWLISWKNRALRDCVRCAH